MKTPNHIVSSPAQLPPLENVFAAAILDGVRLEVKQAVPTACTYEYVAETADGAKAALWTTYGLLIQQAPHSERFIAVFGGPNNDIRFIVCAAHTTELRYAPGAQSIVISDAHGHHIKIEDEKPEKCFELADKLTARNPDIIMMGEI